MVLGRWYQDWYFEVEETPPKGSRIGRAYRVRDVEIETAGRHQDGADDFKHELALRNLLNAEQKSGGVGVCVHETKASPACQLLAACTVVTLGLRALQVNSWYYMRLPSQSRGERG